MSNHASFKEAEFNDKVEFLGASWAEDFVCLMEFPREWPQKLSIRSQPCTFEAWLGFFDLLACRKISLFDVSSYLFDKKDIHRKKKIYRMGTHFHDKVSSTAMPKFRFIFEETSNVGMKIKIRQHLARVFHRNFSYSFLFITWNK